jgi:hypothetical protein
MAGACLLDICAWLLDICSMLYKVVHGCWVSVHGRWIFAHAHGCYKAVLYMTAALPSIADAWLLDICSWLLDTCEWLLYIQYVPGCCVCAFLCMAYQSCTYVTAALPMTAAAWLLDICSRLLDI